MIAIANREDMTGLSPQTSSPIVIGVAGLRLEAFLRVLIRGYWRSDADLTGVPITLCRGLGGRTIPQRFGAIEQAAEGWVVRFFNADEFEKELISLAVAPSSVEHKSKRCGDGGHGERDRHPRR
jgi:hypothetical protein